MAGAAYDRELDAIADQRSPVPGLPYHHAHRRAALPVAIDGYRVLRELGRGGTCVVYLVKDDAGNPFALKIPYPAVRKPRIIGRLLEREVRLQQALDHPGIAKIVRVGAVGELPYLLLEYADGGDLTELWGHCKAMRTTGERIIEALKLLEQVAGAIGYAHEHGVLHRDIKARNILVVGGELKVSDFGLAVAMAGDEVLHSRTATRDRMGTLGYMAPELEISAKNATVASDVYALGAMACWMVTDEVPWADDPDRPYRPLLSTLLGKHAESRVHAVVEETFLGWIAEQPQRRPASVAVMREQIAKMLRLGTAGVLQSSTASASMLAETVATQGPPIATAESRRRIQVRTDPRVILVPELVVHRGRIGPVAVESFIGQGGFGQVFMGRLDGELVAVKLVPATDDRAAARFRDEMRVLSSFTHSNIVRMLDVVHDPDLGAVGLVMEYVPDSLSAWLADPERSAQLKGQVATRLLRDVLAALVYLETSGVLHLDLKPANILIAQRDGILVPKIADFGLARQAAAAGGGIGGTLAWAAPEMLARLVPACRERHPDFAAMMPSSRSDYYAFGLIALHIYAGRVPFEEGDLEARFTWMPDIEDAIGAPRDVQPVLFRCLNPNPERRPASAIEILATWDEALGDDSTDWPAIIASHLRAPALTSAAREVANAVVEALREGPGARVFLRGPAESGRSRLLGAIASLAAIEGVAGGLRVLEGDAVCDDAGGAIVAAGEAPPAGWQVLGIPALDAAAARDLLGAVFGEVVDVDDLAAKLVRAADGKTGLAVRLLRATVSTGIARRTETLAWYLDWVEMDRAALADGEIIARRETLVAGLPADARRLLGALALAAGPVDREGLAQALGLDHPDWCLPAVLLADTTAELGEAFLGASLRARPPEGLDRAAIAPLVEARDPERAFELYAAAGSAHARREAAGLGVWLLTDSHEREMPAYRVIEIADRCEQDGLWLGAADRFVGQHARAWTYFEFRDSNAPGLHDALDKLEAIARELGDPVAAARAQLVRWAAIPVPAPRDISAVDAVVDVLIQAGDEYLRFEGEFGRVFALWHYTLMPDAWRRFMAALETFDLARVPLRLFVCALNYLSAFATTTEQIEGLRPFCIRAHDSVPLNATRARKALAMSKAALDAADGCYDNAHVGLAAVCKCIKRDVEPYTWNNAYKYALSYAPLVGDMTCAKRFSRILHHFTKDDNKRQSVIVIIAAEILRLEGSYTIAVQLLKNVLNASPIITDYVAVMKIVIACDIGNEIELDVRQLDHAATQIRSLAWFTWARILLRQRRLEEAQHAAEMALAVPVEATEDLRFNALTVAARAAVAFWRRDRTPEIRMKALSWIAEIPDAGRWYSVRRVLLAHLEDDPARAGTWLREALVFGLESGMLPFALEAAVALAERFPGAGYDECCQRLVNAIAADLAPEHKAIFLASWRTICA
ncbi:MAG: serine/threonine protein kinase [Candidatus Schekmanbacteria bacterium]|nr:serine/threonine protein kinase [Candidatus Schekmanbacteria bacterium]